MARNATNGRPRGRRRTNIDAQIERLREGYENLGLEWESAALELSMTMATAETARNALLVKRLRALGWTKATAQYDVLRDLYIAPNRSLSQREIMHIRGWSSPNVTRLLHGLEKAGLVNRYLDPNDRRCSRVELTAKGIELCDRLVPSIMNHSVLWAQCFSKDEANQLRDLLERLIEHFEKLANEGTAPQS